MAVYKLEAKQRGPRCSWCAERATLRGFMFARFACDTHLPELQAWDKREQEPDYSDAAFTQGLKP